MGWKTNLEYWRRGPAWLCTFSYLGNRDYLPNLSPKVNLLIQTSIIFSRFYELIYFLATSRRLLHLSIDTTQKWENPLRRGPAAPSRPRLCTFIICGREIVCSIFLCGRGLQPAKQSSKWLWVFTPSLPIYFSGFPSLYFQFVCWHTKAICWYIIRQWKGSIHQINSWPAEKMNNLAT